MRDKMIDVENAIKLANEDGTVTFEEIRAALKNCDFSNAEIEMFFGNSDLLRFLKIKITLESEQRPNQLKCLLKILDKHNF